MVSTADEPSVLIEANPLGKIPTLILTGGKAIHDSSVIVRYFDQQRGGLFGTSHDDIVSNAQLESLCDGINDAALSMIYERRFRPAEAVHEPWLERQWRKITRALAALEQMLPGLGQSHAIGAISLRVTLAYLSLRFAGRWEEQHSALIVWAARFDEAFPHLRQYLPTDRPFHSPS